MAFGTATVGYRASHDGRPVFMDRISCVGPASYTTGGETAFQAYVRAAVARGAMAVITIIPSDCGGYVPVYDAAADKLKVYYSDSNNASDGPMIEVPSTTNLSGVTFIMTVVSN